MGHGGDELSAQLALVEIPVDERHLDDVSRTVLEAIDKTGSLSARQAGEIVYRFRRYELTLSVPGPWLVSAGRPVLERLEELGLLRQKNGRWMRRRAAA